MNSFDFEGAEIAFSQGQTLAAALTRAGERGFRLTETGGSRGIFCGMGVCQDCVLTVDGQVGVRACMTRAAPGMKVSRQAARPKLAPGVAPPPATAEGRVLRPDIAILGAGAGGLAAAAEAAGLGASVIVLDERTTGGGQYYKQGAAHPPMDAQQAEGEALIARARAAGAELLPDVEVWGAFDGPLLLARQGPGALAIRPGKLIVATGAYERPVMVPGWTQPGVMTTGAAQTLWRSYRTLPGRRILICGSGPLNLQVAAELADGGAEVLHVLDTARAPVARPRAALALGLAAPRLAARGLSYLRRVRRHGTEVVHRATLSRIEAAGEGLRAIWSAEDGESREAVVDAVLMNAGFLPQNEVLRLLGAAMTWDAAFAQLRCTRDAECRTTADHLFAIGDCAGLGGAPAAVIEGRIAGRAACRDLGIAGARATSPDDLRELARQRRFQKALWAIFDPAPPARRVADETILCRCEEVTFGAARAALDADAGHLGTLKRASRIGMGRCQGRYCGPVAAALVAERSGRAIEDLSFFAPRVPIKPVAMSAVLAAEGLLDGED